MKKNAETKKEKKRCGWKPWRRLCMTAFFILMVGTAMLSITWVQGNRITVQASDGKAKKAFRNFLKEGRWGANLDSTYDPSTFSFCFLKMGKDKTPVLIVENNSASHADGYVGVFQYIDGEVRCMGVSDKVDSLYRKSGVFALRHVGGGYGTRDIIYYRLDDGNCFEECAYTSILYKKDWKDEYDRLREMNGPDKYEINEKSVSKAEFQKFKKKLTGGEQNKASKIKLRKNTAANRRKYLV